VVAINIASLVVGSLYKTIFVYSNALLTASKRYIHTIHQSIYQNSLFISSEGGILLKVNMNTIGIVLRILDMSTLYQLRN